MKFFALFCFLLIPILGMCISVKDVESLAELNTDEELILQIIYKEGVDHPITAKDVINLRERGLSETVIDLLWKQSHQNKEFLPPQEGESEIVGENLRSYQSTDKEGNKIVVLTNLDENGRPMGPPPPPAPEREMEPLPEVAYVPQQPQVVYVTPRREEPAWATQEQDLQNYQYYPYGSGFPTFTGGYYPVNLTVFSYPFFKPHFGPHCSSNNWLGQKTGSPLWRSPQRTSWKR